MVFRSGRGGSGVIVDPALPPAVQESVRRVARQHPRVLRDPDAVLPRAAGFDYAQLAAAVRGVLATLVLCAVVAPVLLAGLLGTNGAGGVLARHRPLVAAGLVAAVGVSAVLEVLGARVAGGRAAVARDLARARGRYLLPGADLDPAAWASAVRAQRALSGVGVSTFLLTSVEPPDHGAFTRAFWALAKDMAASGSSAAMDSFAAAVEVYAADIGAADAISMLPTTEGPDKERHERAIERADAAGRHALAMAATV